MKNILNIFFVSIFLFTINHIWSQTYNFQNISYNYIELQYEFIHAPEIKKQKIKSIDIKVNKRKHSHLPYFIESKTTYDTNGIPLKFYNTDTEHYYTAYHMTDDFLVDSTKYEIDSLGFLKEKIQFFRKGYNEKYHFYYDSLKRCDKVIEILEDSIINPDSYKYDKLNRLIETKTITRENDTLGFRFIFNKNYIGSTIRFENQKKWIYYKYEFNKWDNSLTEYMTMHKNNRKTNKKYFDEKGNIVREYKYFSETKRIEYNEYDDNNNLISTTGLDLKGSKVIDSWQIENKFGYKNLLINQKVYDKNNDLDSEATFTYEFYD